MMVTIILPTYNEKENILDLIDALRSNIKEPLEILVVDDDSPDLTWKIASECGREGVRVVRRVGERGLATAIDRGIREASGVVVGWMDADMGMPPNVIPDMLRTLDDSDIAIGSRYVKGGKDDRCFFRVLTSVLINRFAGLILGGGISDYDSGFIVMKKKVFEKVAFPSSGYGDYFIELIYKARKAGFRVKEVPYVFKEREKGSSKTAPSMAGFFRLGRGYLTRIIRLRFPGRGDLSGRRTQI